MQDMFLPATIKTTGKKTVETEPNSKRVMFRSVVLMKMAVIISVFPETHIGIRLLPGEGNESLSDLKQ